MNATDAAALGVLGDVEVDVRAQIGCASMSLASVLGLSAGSVIPLDCAPDAPASLIVNGVRVATGDLVVDEAGGLAVEIAELVR